MQNFRRSVPPARSSGRISVYAGQDVVIDGQDEHFTQHGVVDWPEACLGSQLRPCRDFSFTLQVDGVVVPSEPYFRQFPMYDGYEGQVCQWVCDFPPSNLSEGEHVFRGVWTCNGPDCPEGNNILEREITVTVLYEDEFSIRCPGDVIVCSGGAAIQPSRTGEPTVSGGYRDVSIEYEDEGIPGSPGAYERTWEATDSLGRSCECVQILETDSSVFALECPPDAFYERGGSFSPDVTGYPTRGGSVCDSTVVEHEDILNDCAGAYTRIWRIIDAFGEEGQACIQIVEPEAIQIACPPDVTVPCGSSAPTSIAGEASLPGSPPGVGLDHEDETENDCPGSFYRTWFATGDSCNVWSCQQLIEYEPEE
jgi:hypothetical protein